MRNLLAFTLLFSLVGCVAPEPPTQYLPVGATPVGAGFELEHRAAADGTYYVIDANSGRPLVTRSIKKDELFEYGAENFDRLEDQLDIEMYELRPVLYFAPAPREPANPR